MSGERCNDESKWGLRVSSAGVIGEPRAAHEAGRHATGGDEGTLM
jgi:hypothetical protein